MKNGLAASLITTIFLFFVSGCYPDRAVTIITLARDMTNVASTAIDRNQGLGGSLLWLVAIAVCAALVAAIVSGGHGVIMERWRR